MRRLPPWMVFFMGLLSLVLLVIGYEDRHEVGPLPMILGAIWLVFTLGAAGAMFKPEPR